MTDHFALSTTIADSMASAPYYDSSAKTKTLAPYLRRANETARARCGSILDRGAIYVRDHVMPIDAPMIRATTGLSGERD